MHTHGFCLSDDPTPNSKRSLYAFAPNTNKWLDVLGLNKNLSAPYWPPNRGALGEVRSITLPVGTLVDRYGYPGGIFVSTVGTPYPM